MIYPLPWAATALWMVVKQFLDVNTAAKVVPLDGAADRAAPVPEKLKEYAGATALVILAKARDKAQGK